MTAQGRVFLGWLLALLALLAPVAVHAHPAPFSYLTLDLQDEQVEGTLTVHVIDIAHELGVERPDALLDHNELHGHEARIQELLASRMTIGDHRPQVILWGEPWAMAPQSAIRFPFVIRGPPPGALKIDMNLFPYDPQHQSFVTIYEGGEYRQQMAFASGSDPQTYFAGSTQGVLAVLGTFIPSGAHHILIGADHLLFLFGLFLLGGGWRRTVGIVTAFTIGHSITLSLAALDIVTLPGWLVEPAIAMTIVLVGADNLLRGQGRDLRFWMALLFGLIHGFGFAGVLREFGLPQSALGWSLFSFNVGVELGQLAFVLLVVPLLALIRKRSEKLAGIVTKAGSVIVIGAGTWWFVQRVFLTGAGA